VSAPGSTAARRTERNAAIIAAHPRWHGVRHPDLISFPPPKRYSKLDVMPAIGRSALLPPPAEDARHSRADRAAHNLEVLEAHPRWRGIQHPERLVFPEHVREPDSLLRYHDAVLRAVRGVRESERLYSRISAVADAIDRRSWPWAASPAELEPDRPSPPPRWGGLGSLTARLRLPEPARRHARPTARPIPH
jgi:hypothetical protein